MTTPAFVRVLDVRCEVHGSLGCWGSPRRFTRIRSRKVIILADELRRAVYGCRDCEAAGVERPHPLRYETEPVSEADVLKRKPKLMAELEKLQQWVANAQATVGEEEPVSDRAGA